MTPDEVDAFLAEQRTCRVATVGTTGPHATPLWYVWHGGSLWLTSGGFVNDLPHNIGGVETKGFEFNGAYSHRLGDMGNLSASLVGTWLKKFETDNGLTEAYDCVGFYGSTCGAPAPKWRHKARLTWNMPNGIGLSPDEKRLYAASGLSSTLTIIDLAAGKVVRTVTLGGRPWGALAAPK